jgi:hypothetical protein
MSYFAKTVNVTGNYYGIDTGASRCLICRPVLPDGLIMRKAVFLLAVMFQKIYSLIDFLLC